jgi:hypothetical protein
MINELNAIATLWGKSSTKDTDGKVLINGVVPTSSELSEITAEVTRLQAEYDANQYQRNRAEAYPSTVDQLDDIYHNGVDGWKATIKAVKDTYPKETI